MYDMLTQRGIAHIRQWDWFGVPPRRIYHDIPTHGTATNAHGCHFMAPRRIYHGTPTQGTATNP